VLAFFRSWEVKCLLRKLTFRLLSIITWELITGNLLLVVSEIVRLSQFGAHNTYYWGKFLQVQRETNYNRIKCDKDIKFDKISLGEDWSQNKNLKKILKQCRELDKQLVQLILTKNVQESHCIQHKLRRKAIEQTFILFIGDCSTHRIWGQSETIKVSVPSRKHYSQKQSRWTTGLFIRFIISWDWSWGGKKHWIIKFISQRTKIAGFDIERNVWR
jgi:hypothetical protein